MDKITKRPIGLALLLTAAVALMAQQPGRQTGATPILVFGGDAALLRDRPTPAPTPASGSAFGSELNEAQLLARLVLRVESLLQPPTAN